MVKKKPHLSKVTAEKLLASLEEVAEKVGIKVRYENITGGPIKTTHGSCKIKGDNVILIDRRLGIIEKLHALGQELQRFNLEKVFIQPAVRKFLGIEDN